MVFVCGGKLPRQAPSVPIRRAGRRAREVVRVMLYALGGEKSPIGGICNSSGAAHLNRRFLREVRSSFFFVGNWSGRAVERHARQLLFVTFSYSLLLAMSGEQKKFIKTPFRGGKESLCAEGSVCGNGVNCPLSPTTWELSLRASLSGRRDVVPYGGEMEFVRGRFCKRRLFISLPLTGEVARLWRDGEGGIGTRTEFCRKSEQKTPSHPLRGSSPSGGAFRRVASLPKGIFGRKKTRPLG